MFVYFNPASDIFTVGRELSNPEHICTSKKSRGPRKEAPNLYEKLTAQLNDGETLFGAYNKSEGGCEMIVPRFSSNDEFTTFERMYKNGIYSARSFFAVRGMIADRDCKLTRVQTSGC